MSILALLLFDRICPINSFHYYWFCFGDVDGDAIAEEPSRRGGGGGGGGVVVVTAALVAEPGAGTGTRAGG